jgi:hypothetical protein
MAPPFLASPAVEEGWSISHPFPFTPKEIAHSVRRWVLPRAGLDVVERVWEESVQENNIIVL